MLFIAVHGLLRKFQPSFYFRSIYSREQLDAAWLEELLPGCLPLRCEIQLLLHSSGKR